MKNLMKSSIAILALLTSSFAIAQEKTFTFDELNVGDSVMIKEGVNTHYLTGEEPSQWVYGKKFVIGTKGGTRFPEGLLLMPITSWIGAEYLYLTDPTGQPAQQSVEQKAAPKQEEVKQEPIKEEPKQEVKQEPVAEQPAQQQAAVAEETAKEEETPVEKTQAFHRFSIGVRGGTASLMHNNEDNTMGNWKAGFNALLDLQYAYYFAHKVDSKVTHGILTGVSLGYSRSPIANEINDTYTITGDAGEQIDYEISASKVSEKDGQLQIEIPLMYSMLVNGFFLNVGPKVMIPVLKNYNQTISDPHVSATFEDMGVTVTDEVITGYVEDGDLKTSGKWGKGKTNVSLLLSADLGYEWTLKSGNALGLGVYANYAPFNSYSNDTDNVSLIDVTAPNGSNPAGSADILSATDTYTKSMNYFDAGVKLVYHFNFPVKK